MTVKLYRADGVFVAETTTDANGYYRFSVCPGDCFLEFEAPDRCRFTTPNQSTNDDIDSDADTYTGRTECFTMEPGESDCTWDAGLVCLAKVGDFVWQDVNNNGIQDAGEPGIAGVKVELFTNEGILVGDTETDDDGFYGFTVDPGKYYLKFTPSVNCVLVAQDQGVNDLLDSDPSPISGKTATFTLATGETDLSWDAGIVCKANVGDRVWNDLNGNGLQDTGEPGIPGVTVKLYTSTGTLVATTTTDSDGIYGFLVNPGDYYVNFTLPTPDCTFSPQNQGSNDAVDSDAVPATGNTGLLTLDAGEVDLTWDAGIVCKANIGDFVWNDLNGNGIQDTGEPGIPGVTVKLYTSTGTLVATTATNSNGIYGFSVNPGDYYVNFTLPTGSTFSPQNQGSNDAIDSDANPTTGNTGILTVDAGETDLTWDAGVINTATIGDRVWDDLNNNGIQDTGEPGISGVTVKLYTCDTNTLVATTTTNGNGIYGFTVSPGQYHVTFTLPEGYGFAGQDQGTNDGLDSDANPTTGNTVCVTLESGETDLTWDAGMVKKAPSALLTKTASVSSVQAGGQVTFTYTVNNAGGTTLNNVKVIDDNGTPGVLIDDFTVGTITSLAPGQSQTFTVTKSVVIPMCYTVNNQLMEVGTLQAETLPSGDIKITYIQSRNIIDNTYGANAVGYTKDHTFNNFIGSDKAEFRLTNTAGTVVMDFFVDYISASRTFPSGYGSLGVSGGEGKMVKGSAANVLSATTSLTTNLNQSPAFYQFTVDSPPEPNPLWDYYNSYSVVVSKAAFGTAGFGGVTVPSVHNSPPKIGNNEVKPTPCERDVTNTATLTAIDAASGDTLTAAATATVRVTVTSPAP